MNREWTEEELDILRRDRAAKIPVPVTAAKLNRPVPATYLRARRIGTLVQTHQPWDHATVERLRQLVTGDPPLTDKCIAADLGRTVTQIRWKLQDLGLIGVRNLSKLAKAGAARSDGTRAPKSPREKSHRNPKESRKSQETFRSKDAAAHNDTGAPVKGARSNLPETIDIRNGLNRAITRLEAELALRLKASIGTSEAEMVQAALAAITEKARIDQHLAGFRKEATSIAVPQASLEASPDVVRTDRSEKPKPRPRTPKDKPAAKSGAKPVGKSAPLSIGLSIGLTSARQEPPAPAPKIVVMDAPAVAQAIATSEPVLVQTSGRGGWKSVRRDPARASAQAQAKAATRADATDLSQAAQSAIERFIAERGITRVESDPAQLLVSKLQARGYIVVREGDGWVIDQRHRVETETELAAFADARGISRGIAA
jgi:hypothetical protein